MAHRASRFSVRVLIPASRVHARVRALARRIDRDYAGREVVLVGVLKGAFVFMADLCRRLRTPVRCDFLRASSYGDGRRSSGSVRLEFDVTQPVTGAHVILVEDVIDTGLTARRVSALLRARRPASLRVCALLWKSIPRGARRASKGTGGGRGHVHPGVRPDYVGFRIPDVFVVGYGLDLAGRHRNLPYVGVVEPASLHGYFSPRNRR